MRRAPAALTIRRLQRADQKLMKRALRARSPRVDHALVAITRAASYSRMWLAIGGMLACFGGNDGRRAARAGVLAITLASSVANGPAKLMVRRRRPPAGPATLIGMPRSTSFPSGHSATAFAFATATSRELPLLAPALVSLAGAVSYSRVHAGVHYPSDVAAGVAIGIGCGMAARHVGRSVCRAYERRHARSSLF